MKRFVIAVVAIITAVNVSAQDFRWGVTGGVNFVWEKFKVAGVGITSDTYIGFQAGVKMEYDLTKHITDGFYAEANLLYNLKGGSFAGSHVNLGYAELPLNFGYRYPITDKISLLASLGPYFAVGVVGKDVTEEGDTKIKVDVFGEDYKRFDFGLNYKLGVEMWNQWQFYFGYEHSLMNMAKTYKDADSDSADLSAKCHLLNFYIGTAYMF